MKHYIGPINNNYGRYDHVTFLKVYNLASAVMRFMYVHAVIRNEVLPLLLRFIDRINFATSALCII